MMPAERVLEAARGWLGTPFLPGACQRGRGCDCGSFLAGVFADAGVIEPLALGKYDYLAPAMRGDAFYSDLVSLHARAVSEPRPGDIVMYLMGRAYSHAALVVEWPRAVMHACRESGVTMARGDGGRLRGRAPLFFRMNGLI